MAHSLAERPTFTCPVCGQAFTPELWLIIDAAERPDLLARAREGTIHAFACPNGHAGAVDAPLLLFRPGEARPLLFSPAQGTTAEQAREMAGGLLARLAESLGDAWREEWRERVALVPRAALPAVLGGADPEAAVAAALAEAIPAGVQAALAEIAAALAAEGVELQSEEDLQRALAARPELRARLEAALRDAAAGEGTDDEPAPPPAAPPQPPPGPAPEEDELPPLLQALAGFVNARTWIESYQFLLAHPELLTDTADEALAQQVELAKAAGRDEASQVFAQRLALLRRARANGAAAAFAEKMGMTAEELEAAMQVAAAIPPETRRALDEIMAALAAEGVRVESAEDLQRALAARPELAAKLQAATGGSGRGSDVPPPYRAGVDRANAAEARYRATGDAAALDEAAAAWQRILDDPGFPAAPEQFQLAALNDSGGVFLRRYWAGGRLPDLDHALALWGAAVDRTPAGSPDLAGRQNNLGAGLRARYARTGRAADLDAAIAASEAAVAGTPAGSPDLAGRQNNLGNGLSDRYARTGRAEDLDAAIAAYEAAVAGTPAGSPDRARHQNNLGNGLRARYARTGRAADLDAAIAALEAAVAGTPAGSPDLAGRQNNLGTGLRARYARTGRAADLDAAIAAYEAAVAGTPAGSPDLAGRQNNLGNGLRDRYARTGRAADLDAAIAAWEAAVAGTPAGSPDLAGRQNNLGNGLSDRYARTGRAEDLDAAIAASEAAVAGTPAGSPDLAGRQNNLGNGLSDRYARTGRAADLDAAIAACRDAAAAAADTAGEVALGAARAWAGLALRRGLWAEACQAAAQGQATLRRLNEANALAAERESWLKEAQGLAAAAAYAAARDETAGAAAEAARLLETGQARAVNAALGRGRDRELLARLGDDDSALLAAYEAAAADAVVDRIRAWPGYEGLFAPAAFDDLAAAVAPGAPLAYLATTPAGSVILLLHRAGAEVAAEALWAGLTDDELARLLVRRAVAAGNAGPVVGGLLPGQVQGINLTQELAAALPVIGDRLMAPLAARLRALGATAITLIPGGRLNLLPLHAAGYHKDGATVAFLDEFAVAYAPSAQAAAESRERAMRAARGGGAALVVGNPLPLPDGIHPLQFAREEAEAVAELSGAAPLLETAATLAAVQAALPDARVFHFAGHGTFDPREPLNSGLVMAGGERLTLRAVRDSAALAGTQLVVLSACQTGLTDFRELPDEVIGLPAGFLVAGAAGVAGSLWPVDDRSTALLMTDFHRRTGAGVPPAEALRAAQLALRSMTRRQVSDYYMAHMRMPVAVASAAHAELPPGQDSDRIYAEPYYWAGFTYTGA